jgi:hypothetical protein
MGRKSLGKRSLALGELSALAMVSLPEMGAKVTSQNWRKNEICKSENHWENPSD